MPTEEQLHDGFTLGEWEIYPARGVLLRGDEEVRPEPQTWRVMLALSTRNGDLVSKEALVAEVWDGRPVTDDVINRAIGQVRKALDDDAREPAYVKNAAQTRLSFDAVCRVAQTGRARGIAC